MESGPYPGNIKNRIKKEIHIPAGRSPFVFCHAGYEGRNHD